MAEHTKPLGLLFDIGGVCVSAWLSKAIKLPSAALLFNTNQFVQVLSPFQAILDYEISHKITPGWVNFSISRTAPNGSWHKLERGEINLDAKFFSGFTNDLRNPVLWEKFHEYLKLKRKQKSGSNNNNATDSSPIPPMPLVDGERLFWEMMRISRTPDPYIFPALKKLRESGQFVVAALSNTVAFPDGHEYNTDNSKIVSQFDVFVSSAHTGLRKPDPRVYELAIREMEAVAKRKGIDGIAASDIVFLDDIGENLKGAKKVGLRTLKVNLGKSQDAVKELEAITGLRLTENGGNVKL